MHDEEMPQPSMILSDLGYNWCIDTGVQAVSHMSSGLAGCNSVQAYRILAAFVPHLSDVRHPDWSSF